MDSITSFFVNDRHELIGVDFSDNVLENESQHIINVQYIGGIRLIIFILSLSIVCSINFIMVVYVIHEVFM